MTVEVVRTMYGRMMVDIRDVWIGRSLTHLGEYSAEEVRVICSYCDEGTVAFDVGANIGAVALPMAHAVGRGGFVFAFEPQMLIWQMLTGNVALNQVRNVLCMQAAVGARQGKILVPDALDMPDQHVNTGGLELGKGAYDHGKLTPVVRLDDIAIIDEKRVSLIKIDVEGMEADVVRGASATIMRHRPVLYIEVDRPQWNEAIAAVREADYRTYLHRPPLYRRENFAHCEGSPWEGRHIVSFNAICIPNERAEVPSCDVLEIRDHHVQEGVLPDGPILV